MSSIQQALTKINEAAAILSGHTTGGAEPSRLVVPGPDGIAIVDGSAMFLDEPIAADWKVSMEVRELTRLGRIASEPSNAFDSGLPKRSPGGYPMIYGVGQYGPRAPGRIKFAGDSFANESDLDVYRQATNL